MTTAATPGERPRRGGIDPHDPGVGEMAAHEGDVEDVREGDVGHEAAASRQQAAVFLPPRGRPKYEPVSLVTFVLPRSMRHQYASRALGEPC
ncbi:MAG: hypothetical protein U0031_11700 [Thermomicrobiales bacterium]